MVKVILLAALLASCSTLGTVIDQGEELSHRPAIVGLVERLEVYEGASADKLAVLSAFDSREVDLALIQADALAMIARHDAFIEADPELSPIEKRVYLVASSNVRRTIARVVRIE